MEAGRHNKLGGGRRGRAARGRSPGGFPPTVRRVTETREGPQRVAQDLAGVLLCYRAGELTPVDGGQSLRGPSPSPSSGSGRLAGRHRMRRLVLCGGGEKAKAHSSTRGPSPRFWRVDSQL